MTPAAVFAIGYHGCDKKVGEAAIAGKHPLPSTNAYDWLGHGLYFWENDPQRALHWAKSQRVKSPFVLGAVIRLGHSLDLIKVEHLALLQEAHDNLLANFEAIGRPDAMPKNEEGYRGDEDLVKRNLDCAVINNLHAQREEQGLPPFDTVRSPFSEGKPLYEGAGIMDRTHVQICVRQPETSIIGYFRPLI